MTYAIWMMDMVAKGTKGNGASQQSPLNVIETFVENANQPWRNIYSHAKYAEITPFSTTYYVPVPGMGIVGVNDTGLITSVNGMPIASGPGSNYAYFFNALMSAYGSPTPQPQPAPAPQHASTSTRPWLGWRIKSEEEEFIKSFVKILSRQPGYSSTPLMGGVLTPIPGAPAPGAPVVTMQPQGVSNQQQLTE
jgi:hypothetical protein